jgi:Glycosyl hydrolases family 39
VNLLRSSIFYNPRTRSGAWFYANEIRDHHAARLFGVWGWNAKVCKDEADLLERLRDRRSGLEALAKTHDKLIIHISGVPLWLSSSDDTGVFEGGGWQNKQTHSPKDMKVWRRLIRELARVFKTVKGVERYYEFWNEPDLKYWQGGLDEFLELYAETAKVIRKTDPRGEIGGCAVNQWDGRIHKKAKSDPLNFELIRYAGANDLPLDFVSWHHFGRPVSAIAEAKAAYEVELGKAGFGKMPEFLVTEWSSGARGTPYANIPFAETMLGFFESKLQAQTASCLEEFHPKPSPGGFAPWGLITQQGHRKNTWYVHRFFDRLAQKSLGVTVVRPDERRTLLVSRKAGGVYDVLVWDRGTPARLKAAWESLLASGYTSKEAALAFKIGDRLERAIAAGESSGKKWDAAFAAAKKVYDAHPVQTPRFVLELTGAGSVEVLEAEAVRMGLQARRAAVLGNTLSVPLAPQEVLRLRLRVQ